MSREMRIGVLAGLILLVAVGVIMRDFSERQSAADSEAVAAPAPREQSPAGQAVDGEATAAEEPMHPRIRVLMTEMQSGSASARAAAAAAMGFHSQAGENSSVLAMLKKLSHDADAGVRTEAAIALARLLRPEDHGPTALRMLGETNWSRTNLYVHMAYLACDDPQYAVHLLPGLTSAVPAERELARGMVADMPEDVSDAFWTLATDNSDLGTRFGAIHGLVLMGNNSLAMLEEKLDGLDKALAMQILDKIADDGEQRTPDEWKGWIEDRLAAPDEDNSDESFMPDAPMMA